MMEIRGAQFNWFGGIDCEIEHPKHGWIPFTAMPDDSEPLGAQVFEAAKDTATPYTPPPEPTPEELLAAERAAMKCTPAQMRLALHRMGLLATVQGIADADPEAAIVWEYATRIVRNSPLIEALSGDFTGSDIDEIFRAAMAI